MTLTHLVPSVRTILPAPLNQNLWPEFSVCSTTDVSIAGVSLLRLVDWCETPCVHTAAAVVPGTNGRPSETELASVVVTAIVEFDSGGGFWVDARLDGCQPIIAETRLIGRASTAQDRQVRLRPAAEELVALPGDLRIGDLLAIPCLGVTTLHDVRPPAQHRERPNRETSDSDDRIAGDLDWAPGTHCSR